MLEKTSKADEKGKATSSNPRAYIAAWLQTEETVQGKILTVRLDDAVTSTERFKLVNGEDQSDLVFMVDSITNQENHLPDATFNDNQQFLTLISFIVSVILAFVVPYAFILLLTRFRNQDSSLAERAWMMSWLAASQLSYIFVFTWGVALPHFSWSSIHWDAVGITAGLMLFFPVWVSFIPAFGGLVTVGKMFLEFNTCS